MISLVIFSKDRALQMDLLLQSNAKHCGKLFHDVVVLYAASTPKFEDGYQKLAKAWPEVKFVRERKFEEDTREILRESANLVCILSDDCIFYRNVVDYQDQILDVIARERIFSYILGIGGDSRYSGTCRHRFRMPEFEREKETLIWNWQKADKGEFECPFMLAANIYKKEDYLFCVDRVRFQNPSTFENQLQKKWQYSPDRVEMKKFCACLEEQKLVHSLNNRVQDIFRNRHGEIYPFSAPAMNEAYLSGKVVDLDALEFSEVDGLHKEIDLVLRNEA
jgi:hypothetical protein